MHAWRHLAAVVLLGLAPCIGALAQAPDSPTQQSSPADAKTDHQAKAKDEQTPSAEKRADEKNKADEQERAIEKKEQSQRLLGAIPDFATTSRRSPPPLTPDQKFHLFVKSSFDPVEFGVVGLQAGISQAEDEFPEYGQGAAGFGKRYGATLADEVSSGFFANYFYPVLFKEDPRYFRLGEGSIVHRLGYALLQEVDCRTDKGKRSFAWSNVLGAFSSGGLSNAYYPASERGFGLTMSRSAISAGYGSLGGIVNEFYPDISHWLFHRHDKAALQK